MLGSDSPGTICEGMNGVKYSCFPLIFHPEKLLETVQTFEKEKIFWYIWSISELNNVQYLDNHIDPVAILI